LLRILGEYNKDADSNLYGSSNLANLIKTYGFIRYTINSKIYTSNIVDETPSDYKGQNLYYQVPASIKNAATIELVIRIRNKELVYKLK
jgi:hypothetical protein